MQLQLLYGGLERRTRIVPRCIALSQHTIKIACENYVLGGVSEVVGDCVVEETLSLGAVYCSRWSVNATKCGIENTQSDQATI